MVKPNRKVAIPKVRNSRDAELDSSSIPTREDDPAFFSQDFFCHGEIPGGKHCQAKACAKRKYDKTVKGKKVSVSGNFYLAPEAFHQTNCSFDFAAQAHHLHTTYQDVIVKKENHYLLVVPSSRGSKESACSGPRTDPEKDGLPSIHTSKSTHKSRAQLQRVRIAAESIRALLERFEDDRKARSFFRITYAGTEYDWAEFFFNADTDVQKLYRTVQRDTQNGISRPLVIYGTVGEETKLNKNGKYPIWILNRSRATVPGAKEIISVNLYTSDQGALKLKKHQRILAIGMWFIGTHNKRYLSTTVTADTYAPLGA